MSKVQGAVLRPPEPPIQILQLIPFVIWMVASVFTAPLEMLLRPKFGTRYLSPLVVVASWLVVQIFQIGGLFISIVAPSLAPIGIGTVVTAFDIGCIVHFIRLLPAFKDLSKERLSTTDGPGWAVFGALPKAESWLMVRAVYEPGFALAAVVVLHTLGIVSGVAAAYLGLSAVALFVKVGFTWWSTFAFKRNGADAAVVAEVVGQVHAQQMGRPDLDSETLWVVGGER